MAASTAFSAQGTAITVNDDPDGVGSAVAIANVKTFSVGGGQATEIDITHLGSTAKEFLLGLEDFGTLTLNVDINYTDAGQVDLRGLKSSGNVGEFVITLPNATTLTFRGRVRSETADGGVDQALTGSFDVRITGAITVA